MENSRPPLSTEAQTAVSMTAAAIVAGTLVLVLFYAGGLPVLLMTMPLAATISIFAVQSWRQALRHGWRTSGDDDGEDWPRGGGPERPLGPEGPPSGTHIDWEQFSSEFWAHVNARDPGPVRSR